jgi:hypothetical protein
VSINRWSIARERTLHWSLRATIGRTLQSGLRGAKKLGVQITERLCAPQESQKKRRSYLQSETAIDQLYKILHGAYGDSNSGLSTSGKALCLS